MTYRVLVTGSRDWVDRMSLYAMLAKIHSEHEGMVVVHGDCPTGADRMAQDWADLMGVEAERYPANWDKHGRAAGPIRNRRMVKSKPKPVLCLAFIRNGSRGATGCADAAEAARIPTMRFSA